MKVADLASKLDGIAEQERQNVAAALRLDPPGKLRREERSLIEALQLRVNGIQGLADTFRNRARRRARDAALLAAQAERLLASDVIWDDLFRGPADGEMKQRGRQRRRVPTRTSSRTET